MTTYAWWRERSAREQAVLTIGAAALLSLSLFIFVHEPLFERLARAEATARAEQVTLGELNALALQAAQLRKLPAIELRLPEGQSMIAFINSSAIEFGLETYLRRIVPRGRSLSIVFEAAPFDEIARWLTMLARDHGLHVEQLTLDRARKSDGAVNVNLAFATPSGVSSAQTN